MIHPDFAGGQSGALKKERKCAQSCLTLCDPMDCSLPGSSVHGIFQALVLEWIAVSFSRGSSRPGDWTRVSRIVDRHFTVWATREVNRKLQIKTTMWYHVMPMRMAVTKDRHGWMDKQNVMYAAAAKSLQLCLTLCNPMDYSPPGSSVHGILQARILEWVAMFLFKGSSWSRDLVLANKFFTTSATWEAFYKGLNSKYFRLCGPRGKWNLIMHIFI